MFSMDIEEMTPSTISDSGYSSEAGSDASLDCPWPATAFANTELAGVFKDLQLLCSILNSDCPQRDALSPTDYQSRICSAQYILLRLQGSLDTVLAECLRLTMLAFLATTFQIPGTKFHYPYLARCWRDCLCALEVARLDHREIFFWMMTMGAMSVFAEDSTWLRDRWQCVAPPHMAWDEARGQLKAFLWIDAIHDQHGLQSFDALDPGTVREDNKDNDNTTTRQWGNGWAGNLYEL